jgi:hypothetical protein
MDFSIKGPGGGLSFSRQGLPERRRARQDRPAPERGASRVPADWTHELGAAEQLRALSVSVHQAIEATETAAAWIGAAAAGLEEALAHLSAMEEALAAARAAGRPACLAAWADLQERWRKHCRAIDAVGHKTRFGSVALLDGTLGCRAAAFGPGLTLVSAGEGARSSPPDGFPVIIRQEPTRCTLIGELPLDDDAIAGGVALAVIASGRRATATARPPQTRAEVAEALAAAARAADLPVSVLAGPGGRLLIQHARHGSAHRLAAESSLPGILSRLDGTPMEAANGRDVAGTIAGEPATGRGLILTGDPYNRRTAGMTVRYFPATGGAPGWKRGEFEAGRVAVSQQRLHLRWEAPDCAPVSLRLDAVRCANLGRGVDDRDEPVSLENLPGWPPARSETAADVLRRASEQVRDILRQVQHAQRQALPRHLARLSVQAQNLEAAGSAITAPQVALDAARVLARGLSGDAAQLGALRRGLTPSALLRLLDGNDAPEERSTLN